MELNVLGAVVAVAVGAFLGFYGSFRLKKRVKKLTDCILLISQFRSSVRFSNCTVKEMLTQATENEQFSELTFLKKLSDCDGSELKTVWRNAVREETELSDDDKEALCGLGNTLGATDKEGQLLSFEQFSELLERHLEEANEEYQKKGRMYRSVGSLGGIAVGIVII